MSDKVVFRIRFDGDSPDLRSHQLSLGEFAKALESLLGAFQKKAQQIVQNRPDVARISRIGRKLDLQLFEIGAGSLDLSFECIYEDSDPGDDIEKLTVSAIIRDIQSESSGTRVNPSIRKFLSRLPEKVSRQSYLGTSGGEIIGRFESSAVHRTDLEMRHLPSVKWITGTIHGVTFDEQKTVTIRTASGRKLRCTVNSELLDLALSLRDSSVNARVVTNAHHKRLISLQGVDVKIPRLSDSELNEQILDKWSDAFRRLAE